MARADLLIRLVRSGIRGDRASFRKVVQAISAEERTKQHTVLAEKLDELLNAAPVDRLFNNGGDPMCGEGVPIIITESEKLSGRKPEYRLLDDSELMLTIFAAQPPHGED